jgi:orotate phosphoribosyltransferase
MDIQAMKDRLLVLLKQEAFQEGEFTLSSGKKSSYYLDGRLITLTPEGAYLAASIILELIKGQGIDAIGGPTLGADPIIGAVAALCHINKIPLKAFLVRKAAKGHGTAKQIEGPLLAKGSRVVIVDDVATTGKALLEAKQALDNIGVKVVKAIVIVDRQEGARETLSGAGIEFAPVFSISDIRARP